MTEEVPTPGAAENSTPTPAENNTQPQTLTGEVQVKPTDVTEPIKPTEYPQGFNADTFNIQTGEIRKDGVLKSIEDLKAESENWKKQATDMRKIVSKGKALESAEEYVSKYNAPEEFAKYYDADNADNADVMEVVNTLADGAKQQGLNEEQFNFMLDNFNNAMTKAGVFDPRTQEQISLDTNDWINKENAKISDNPVQAKQIIKANVDFVKNSNQFSDEEKSFMVGEILDKGAMGVSIMNKFRELFGGKGQDIPTVDIKDSGLSSDASLAEEFYKGDTTSARRQEIIQQRMDAGRQGGLPLPRKG